MAAVLSEGSDLAGYRIERVLGAGGMGTVYLVENQDPPRLEAVKVLSAELSHDPSFRARFARQADVAAKLNHSNVASVYGRGEFEGHLWISTQFVEGTDADQALLAGAMTLTRAIHVVAEVAKALDYAHQRKVVHRNVKPGNILLSGLVGPDERVLLGDFGIASALDNTKMSAIGSSFATVSYAAPEVLAGHSFDGRADVYSLGCVLFRFLTGQPPYSARNGTAGVITAHMSTPPPRVTEMVPRLSPQIDAVVATAMAKDPGQRFSSAREFAAAAAHALDDRAATALGAGANGALTSAAETGGDGANPGESGGPPPTWGNPQAGWAPSHGAVPGWVPPQRRRRPWRWIAAAAALVVVVAAGVAVALHLTSAHRASPTPTSQLTSGMVGASGLADLLLPPQQVADMIGAAEMGKTTSVPSLDTTGAIAQKECIGAWTPAHRETYGNTGLIGVKSGVLLANETPLVHIVIEAVLAYSSGDVAKKFLADQSAQWSACAGRTVTTDNNARRPFVFGQLVNTGGIMSISQKAGDDPRWGCQRAMGVRTNVVIDIRVCRLDVTNQAVDVLNAIAAKIR